MAYIKGRGHTHWGPGTSMVQFVPNGIMSGMGACCGSCAKKGGSCGGCGMGLFDSGLDLTQWGYAEWGVAFLALWGLSSVFSTGKRGYSAVKRVRRKRKKRAALKKELAAI